MVMVAMTGASGAGKSSIANELLARGFAVQMEVGRQIVSEQIATSSTNTPFQNAVGFRDLLFVRSVAAYDRWIQHKAPVVFFDRTFIEALAFSHIIGEPISTSMLHEAQKRSFHPVAFVCSPWQEIYRKDNERSHDFEFAKRDYDANCKAYSNAGYELIEVPKLSIEERADFVLENMAL
tara:strand:+ start:13600 stop:14136 length:537 start_codon:yes stop_codon:yes gene_type:complete